MKSTTRTSFSIHHRQGSLTLPYSRTCRSGMLAALAITVLLGALAPAFAQDLGEVAFRQALLDLGNDFRLMCVAAHPDDEDGATLAYYRMRHGAETFAVIATRGEGGQNEIGPELYEALAVIRTREMQAASAITGANLHFLDLPEFGYSKTPEETLEIWGAEEALRRMVRKIREIRPQVVITHHGREKDHGHHQAIGATLIKAFDVAADPAAFPEQREEGLEPWQVSRLYIRNWQGGADSVEVPIHELEPVRGITYAEVAARALEAHQSQGMKFFIDRYRQGGMRPAYELVKGAPSTSGTSAVADAPFGALFTGLPQEVPAARRTLSSSTESRGALKENLLKEAAAAFAARETSADARRLWERANRAAILALDLHLAARVADEVLVPGQRIEVTASFTDFGTRDASVDAFALESASGATLVQTIDAPASDSRPVQASLDYALPQDTPLSLPAAEHLRETNALKPQFEAVAKAVAGGVSLELRAPVRVEVAAPLAIEFIDAPYLFLPGGDPTQLAVRVTNNAPSPLNAVLTLETPEGWTNGQPGVPVSLETDGQQTVALFTVSTPPDAGEGVHSLRASIAGQHPVIAKAAVVRLERGGDAGPGIGLIESYDDTLRRVLGKILRVTPLEENGLFLESIDGYTAIIVDMRAYQYRKDLQAQNQALLDYVHRGGTLIVMYQKTFDWKPGYAPYPLQVSRNRVTREDAPVTLLVPEHPLFHTPNEVLPGDWDGWIQERGLYFPDTWDAAYTPLLEMQDPGEANPPGALLVARYGAGAYVYTSLVWYRQLRELHPGALRLMLNMLAL